MLDQERIKENLIHKIPSEKRLVELITKLSVQFTANRENIGEYWESAELVSAYTYFYFPTNYAKFSWAIEKIGSDFISDDLEIIDMGTGPGTFLHAFKDHFPKLKSFYGIEHSKPMRSQANLLWEKTFNVEAKFFETTKELPKKQGKRLVIFGHSLNEMDFEKVKKSLHSIEADYLLFIEPGTKESFSKIKEMRGYLLSEKFKIFYPCPSAHACPMEGTDNWCHQYVMAKYDSDVERLCQLVKLDRRHMPVIMHFYGREGEPKVYHENEAFIVQTFPESKFSVEWEVCRNQYSTSIEHLQLLKRALKKSDVKELKSLYAGDSFRFEIDKEISENNFRLKKIEPLP